MSEPIEEKFRQQREASVEYLVKKELSSGNPIRNCDIPFWFKEDPYYPEYYDNYKRSLLESKTEIVEEKELTEDEKLFKDLFGDKTPLNEKKAEYTEREKQLKKEIKLKTLAEEHTKEEITWVEKRRQYNKQRYLNLKVKEYSGNMPITSAWRDDEIVICPACNTSDASKSGFLLKSKEKRQRFRCKKCGYVFSEKII